MVVYSLELHLASVTDTLTAVIEPWPIVLGDSALVGFRATPKAERQLFQYNARERRHVDQPLPEDVGMFYNDLALSSDGRHLAYVADDSLGPRAVIWAIDSARSLLSGPVTSGCDCDVDMNHARWIDSDSFEVAVFGGDSPGGWLLVAGSATARRYTLDTLAKEPQWHRPTH